MSERELCAPCRGFHPDPGTPAACVSFIRAELDDSFVYYRRDWWGRRPRRPTLADDLMIVVKDQRAHIANLEAMLLPHLTAPQAEQAELL